jgi:hypothetical protein
MIRVVFFLLPLFITGMASQVRAAVILYDNTTIDTFDTIFYSIGPYSGLGDEIQLAAAGSATGALVELFNHGSAGTFDAELDFYDVGSPVGTLLGSSALTGVSSTGGDVLDLTFNLGAGIPLPQNLVFLISVLNQSSSSMDLGVDMFRGPEVGASDPNFMIAASSGTDSFQLATVDENVFFQLTGNASTAVPETSTLPLLGAGLLFFQVYAGLVKGLTRVFSAR